MNLKRKKTYENKKGAIQLSVNAAGHLKNPPIKGSFHLLFFKSYVIPFLTFYLKLILKPIKT